MSSIWGIYYFDREHLVSLAEMESMAACLTHRGREQTHYMMRNVGLGYSHFLKPPLPRPPGAREEHAAVVDGTIYNDDFNFREVGVHQMEPFLLSAELAELIGKSYRANDFSFFARINGAFAVAIWDSQANRLTLARDRFGVKPLYYGEDRYRVVFASEAKAIISISTQRPSVNYAAIQEYLTFRYVAGGLTLFSGIYELQPGSILTWTGKDRSEIRYCPEPHENSASKDPRQDIDHLDALLRRSIKRRTRVFGRIGANCSGGIDSGLVTSLTSLMTGRVVHTFTVGFQEKEWDERPYAKLISDLYKTHHHELVVSSDQFVGHLAKLNWYNDNPLSDPNSVLVFILSEHAKEFVDTLLNGEGADEVLLGYPRYNIINIWRFLRSWSPALRSILVRVLSLSKDPRIVKLARALAQEADDALIYNSAFVSHNSADFVLRDDLRSTSFPSRQALTAEFGGQNVLDSLMLYETRTYMLSSLNRLDKMGMAAGLESTPAFLDNDLFDFLVRIPKSRKLSLFQNKIILRELASRYLPQQVMRMPKSGFGVPIGTWFQSNKYLRALLADLPESRAITEVMHRDRLRMIIDAHLSGKTDNGELIWGVLNYAIWHDQYYRT